MNRILNKFYTSTLLLSILMLLGCNKQSYEFGSLAFNRLPEKTAIDQAYSYSGKVIIIGAGASGLAAATILEKNNIDYQIIEATDRYGGRVKKVEGFSDFPIDVGAEWIHNHAEILNRLKGKEGDEIDEELISYRLESSAFWDGKNYKEVPKKELDEYFEGFPEYKFKNSTWYDYVDENFAQKVKHKIRYNSPVVEIDHSGNSVKLTLKSGEVISADRVLVTVSVGVLQSGYIKFIPDLGPEKKKVLETVEFLPGFKLAMKFSENFYPNVISCKTEKGSKEFYDVAYKKKSKDNVLGLLSTGNSAKSYMNLGSDHAIVNSVLAELDQMFDGNASASYTGEYIINDWSSHEFTKGTWSSSLLDASEKDAINSSLNDKVFFSGDANDVYQQMGVPGAIMSGYYSIDLLLTN